MFKFSFVLSLGVVIVVLHADAQGALIQHFNEVGNDVVVTYSGSVDLGSTFFTDTNTDNFGARPAMSSAGVLPSLTADPGGVYIIDRFIGEDLLAPDLSDTFVIGAINSSGLFVFNNVIDISNQWFPVLNNNVADVSVLDASGNLSGQSYAFTNQTFATLGIDQWEGLGPQNLWGVSAAPPESGLIQFQVGSGGASGSAVPEPASWLLMAIGTAGLAARRRWKRKTQ